MAYVDEVLADSPVAYYRLDESSGQPQDSSGNGNDTDTSFGSAPTYSVTSLLTSGGGTAITFNNSAHFSAPDDATLDIGDVFTLECWIRRTVTGVNEAIMDKGANAFRWYITSTGVVTLEKSGVADAIRSSVTMQNTDTHHLVVTKNGATRVVYMDAVDVTSGSPPANQTIESNAVALFLGAQANSGIPSRSTLDEIAIYGTALSQARIQAHYDAGIAESAGIVFNRFYGPALLTGSAATLYTVPTGKIARVLHTHASNPSASEVDLNLSIGTDAAATRVYDDFPISADSVESNYDPYDLAAGDTIQGWAGTAGTVVLTITGYEVPE